MNHIDEDILRENVRDALDIDSYLGQLHGAWIVGSMARDDKFINEGSDVDVIVSFTTSEAMNEFKFDEYGIEHITVPLRDGTIIGDGLHPLDVRVEKHTEEPSGDTISLI